MMDISSKSRITIKLVSKIKVFNHFIIRYGMGGGWWGFEPVCSPTVAITGFIHCTLRQCYWSPSSSSYSFDSSSNLKVFICTCSLTEVKQSLLFLLLFCILSILGLFLYTGHVQPFLALFPSRFSSVQIFHVRFVYWTLQRPAIDRIQFYLFVSKLLSKHILTTLANNKS